MQESNQTNSNENYGIVIAGHGSRDKDGVREFEETVSLFKQQNRRHVITHGFLEFATPTIDEAIRENIRRGSKKVVMVPGILFAASHGKNDMPVELLSMKKEFPDIEFFYSAEMGISPLLLQLFQERIIQAEAQAQRMIKREDTLLVVVGRGTTDSDVNSNVYKLARMVEEGMGFGASYVCYSGTARPKVQSGLEFAAKMGFSRLIVIPYFLFTGVLIKRIYQAADVVSQEHPQIEILKAGYLGVHSHVANVWAERAEEGVEGKAAMNCSLCKYRVQIIGYENEVGKVQEAHHHHVRGLNAKHSHNYSNGKDSHHRHSHQDASHHTHSHHEPQPEIVPYQPHPIEQESFGIIETGMDWSSYPENHRPVLQRLVHTTGDFSIIKEIRITPGAVGIGVNSLSQGIRIITDVTMVQSGLKRLLLQQLGVDVVCGVHDRETHLLAEASTITRSAAGIRRAWEKYGDEVIVAIGDAPTAVFETVRLIQEQQWRPHLVIGLPVGFVGTEDCKEALHQCVDTPQITNYGNRGGSPWAAAAVNALLIQAVNRLALS